MGFSSKQVPCDDHIQAWNQHHSLIQSSNQDDDNSNIDQRVTSAALRIPIKSGGGGDPLHHHHQKLNCPRCDSTNTKFCYYNNYNRSQPRYFCKSCKRHWTQGGTLRKVPVGGNGRKIRSKISNKRVKTSSSSSSKPKDQGIPAADDKEFRHTIFSPQDQLIWADTSIDFVLGRSLDSTNKGSSFLGRDNSALSLQSPDDQIHQEIQDLTGFHYPSLSPLRCNTIFNSSSSSTPTCSSNHLYESVALEEETIMDVAAGLDAAGNNINDCSINDHQIWKSSVLDATILQGWEEIDKFDITIPWEDEDDP